MIIKHPDSVYAPNKRKGSEWFKVKPEYAAGVVDDLDLIIIGEKTLAAAWFYAFVREFCNGFGYRGTRVLYTNCNSHQK